MTPNEYQQESMRTMPERYPDMDNLTERDKQRIHAILGITSEAGELADALKKYFIYGQRLNITNIKEELGDMMWYIVLLCEFCNFNLDDVLETNKRKLAIRYPEKFTEKDALERKDKNEDRS